MSALLWQPSPERVAHANITAFAARIAAKYGVALPDFAALYQWSIDDSEAFWRELWEYGGVIGEMGGQRNAGSGVRTLIDSDKMPGAQWFPDAKLNFAENLLSRRALDDPGAALVFWGEDKVKRRVSHAELYAVVSRVAQGLRALGVK